MKKWQGIVLVAMVFAGGMLSIFLPQHDLLKDLGRIISTWSIVALIIFSDDLLKENKIHKAFFMVMLLIALVLTMQTLDRFYLIEEVNKMQSEIENLKNKK